MPKVTVSLGYAEVLDLPVWADDAVDWAELQGRDAPGARTVLAAVNAALESYEPNIARPVPLSLSRAEAAAVRELAGLHERAAEEDAAGMAVAETIGGTRAAHILYEDARRARTIRAAVDAAAPAPSPAGGD